MPFNVNTFKADGLKLGGVRPTQFEVDIFVPQALINNNVSRIKFFCHATTTPPMIQDSIRVPYFGRSIKYAGDRDFPDWTVSVFNDEDFPVRLLMERWSNEINAMVSNRMSSDVFPTGYKTSAVVTQFGKDGTKLKGYVMEGIFPVNVDAMALSWDAVNQIQTFDVTFAYDLWVPDDTIQTLGPNFNPILPDEGQG
jgi:hypothetical protein